MEQLLGLACLALHALGLSQLRVVHLHDVLNLTGVGDDARSRCVYLKFLVPSTRLFLNNCGVVVADEGVVA